MAAPPLPQDVTDHLTAAIQLSNNHIHLRFLEEAETLLLLQMPAAAVVVAGVVLESYIRGQGDRVDSSESQRIAEWSRMRNAAVNSREQLLTMDEAREMVAGVRALLLRATANAPQLPLKADPNTTPGGVRGKYKFIPTSSEGFIARKADELRLEHQ